MTERCIPAAEGVLDLFHAAVHLAELARSARGDDEELRAWLDRVRREYLANGRARVCQFVAMKTATVAAPRASQVAYPAMANDFLGAAGPVQGRGATGPSRSIGSGLIERTINQRVGRRMKRSDTRWLADHVSPPVEITTFVDGPEWGDY